MLATRNQQQVPSSQRGTWIMPGSPPWWKRLPEKSTPKKYSFRQRIFGPMDSHLGERLGLMSRLFYGWLYTYDQYYVRVDQELREKGL